MPPDISKFLINPYLVDTLSQPFSTLSRQTTALGDPLLTNGAGKKPASTHSPPPCTPGHLHSTTGRQELVTFMENQGYQWIGTAGNILLIFLLNAISRDWRPFLSPRQDVSARVLGIVFIFILHLSRQLSSWKSRLPASSYFPGGVHSSAMAASILFLIRQGSSQARQYKGKTS